MHAAGPNAAELQRVDTLQRVLQLVVQRLEPEEAVQLVQVRKPPPSLPPVLDAPLPSLPLTAHPVHVFCWLGESPRESRG